MYVLSRTVQISECHGVSLGVHLNFASSVAETLRIEKREGGDVVQLLDVFFVSGESQHFSLRARKICEIYINFNNLHTSLQLEVH
jgi:hypothetical protein